MRRTKIICTLGPATDAPGVLQEMIKSGMNVARCNFSHADHSEHKERMDMVKNVRKELGMPVGIMLDTRGPEIRIKTFKEEAFVDGKILLEDGQKFTLTTKDIEGDNTCVAITYEGLPKDVTKGTRILIDDGLIGLEVLETTDTDVLCVVQNSGKLSNRKSINVPNVKISMEYISAKDKADLIFGCEQQVDYVAASFVRTAKDVNELRKVLNDNGGSDIQVIAKIENMEGINNIDEILEVVDGVMVARGDMGVEIEFATLPQVQKMLIKKCLAKGKRVITATQMLESMAQNPRPTRAEVSDVANAVYDGTSCIMLSGESSVGKYPVETVATMAKIAQIAENDIDYKERRTQREEFRLLSDAAKNGDVNPVTYAIAHATCTTTEALDSKAILAFTQSGFTAKSVSAFRPSVPVIAATPDERTYHQLSMSWGVLPMICETPMNSDDIVTLGEKVAKNSGLCKSEDMITITHGVPFGQSGDTNKIRIHKII